MKKALIVTYYWPPAGGPGVQRVLKFAKYLPELGWRPIILTVKNGEYPAIDSSLQNEIPDECVVYKTGSLEPNILYKRFVGYKKSEKIPIALLAEKDLSRKKKLANWVRLNFFIPDAKIGWMFFAVKEGKKIINELKPEVIFSSSPPPTVHLIAKKLADYGGIKWIADFRDPWTDIHYYEDNKRYNFSKRIDSSLENEVLKKADVITCISQLDIEESFSKKIDPKKCYNIPNGYDENDFVGLEKKFKKNSKFMLVHTGAVGKERNPVNLFKAIKRLNDEGKITKNSFTIKFIGNIENSVLNTINELGIIDFVELVAYLPHREAIQESLSANIMLLLVTQSKNNRRILPGKTFEYMRICGNILVLGPEEGETARIIRSSKVGVVIDYNNFDKIYQTLADALREFKNGNYQNRLAPERIKNYERKELTKRLVSLF